MTERPFTPEDLAAQREALLAEIAEPGHFTKDEAREVANTRATPRQVLCPIEPADRDQADEVAAWLTSLPAGSHATFASDQGRIYRTDRSVKVAGAVGLTITDAALRVGAPSSELDGQGRSLRRHLWFTKCTDLALHRVSVSGQNVTQETGEPAGLDDQGTYDAAREWEHALAVEDCEGVTVTDFSADAIFGDGAYWRRVTAGRIDGFTVSRNGRQGVAMIATNGLRLLNGVVRNSRRSGIDLEPNFPGEVIQDVEIGHMDIRSRLLPLTAGGPGTVRDVHVHDIEARSNTAPTLSLVPNSGGRRDGWTVERWTGHANLGSPLPAVRGFNVDGLVMRDVTIPCDWRREMTGVGVDHAGTVELVRCYFPGAARLVTISNPEANHSLRVEDCNPLT